MVITTARKVSVAVTVTVSTYNNPPSDVLHPYILVNTASTSSADCAVPLKSRASAPFTIE